MDKNKTSLKRNLKEKITHTTTSHRQIIIRDLDSAKTIGKTALEFREDYNIVDVPTAISKINHKDMVIYSSYPDRYTVLDRDGVTRKTVKYWLVEYSPKSIGGVA